MNKGVYWCSNCQVPLLTPKCDICNETYKVPFAKDIVPVFAEEMDLLRDKLGFNELPKKSRNFYLWNSKNHYYRLGKKVAKVKYNSSNTPILEVLDPKPLSLKPRISNKSLTLTERITLANKEHLQDIQYEAVSFIRSMLHSNTNHVPVVAFSGGKDSTVLSILARSVLPATELLHVFGDTGIESPDTKNFVEFYRKSNSLLPFVIAKPNVDFYDMCKVLGPPSRIKRWCCSTQKTFPLGVVYNAISRNSPVMSLCGVRRSESTRRNTHKRVLTNTKIVNEMMICPILHWSDAEVWIFLISENHEINRAYKRGYRRVGCIHCPWNSKWSDFIKSSFYQQETKTWDHLINSYYESRTNSEDFMPGTMRWKVRAGGLTRSDDLAQLDISQCEEDSNSFSVDTVNSISPNFFEYLKPFGQLNIVYDDGVISECIITDNNRTPLFSARISKPRNHIRFTIFVDKKKYLLSQRIIRQVRKSTACVLCGMCQIVCPTNAITCNGKYIVDTNKCINCLKCVTDHRGSCVAAHATKVSGRR